MDDLEHDDQGRAGDGAEPVAQRAIGSELSATVCTTVGLAALALALCAVAGQVGVSTLLKVPFVALFWGGLMWLAFRHRLRRSWDTAPIARRAPGGERRGLVRGTVASATSAAALLLLTGLYDLIGWGDGAADLIIGIFLGLAVWSGLHLRDLRRWEAEHDVEVWSRSGVRQIAWTSAQAQQRLVLVERPS